MTLTRLRPALVVVAFLATTLTACSGTEATTCGEFADMSAQEKRDTVTAIFDEAGEDVSALGEGDEGLDLGAQVITDACAGASEDDTLEDVFE